MAVEHEELRLVAPDNTVLVAQRWTPIATPCRTEVLVLHGYADHAERYRELAHHFASRGLGILALDMRGHGRSEGRRGYVDRFEDYYLDIETGLSALQHEHRFVLAHSNGALAALDYLGVQDARLSGLVVTSPFLALAMHVPELKLRLGQLAGAVWPALKMPSGLEPDAMSHDAEIVDAYRRDPRVFTTATAGWFREALIAQQRVRTLRELSFPLLFVYSDTDPVAAPQASRDLADALVVEDKTVWVRHGELHEILNEVDRAALHDQIADWILERVP